MAKHSHTYRSLSVFIPLLLILTAATPLVLYACGLSGVGAATVAVAAPTAPSDAPSSPCADADEAVSECKVTACSTDEIDQDAVLTADLSPSRTWLLPAAFVVELFESSLSPPSFLSYRNVAEDASRPSASIRLLTSTFLL